MIDDDLDWRTSELASLKIIFKSSDINDSQRPGLLRALWTLLYAHYEGFCKYVLAAYVEEVEKLSIKRGDLSRIIRINSLSKEFEKVHSDKSFSTKQMLFDLINDPNASAYSLIRLETSNLWPRVLEEHLLRNDLRCSSLASETIYLKTLVSRRNEIAHGQKNIIKTLEDYKPYEDAAFHVMCDVGVAVSDAMKNQAYRSDRSVDDDFSI